MDDTKQQREVYEAIHKTISGFPIEHSMQGLLDCMGEIIGFVAHNEADAERMCIEVPGHLLSIIRSNWTYLREHHDAVRRAVAAQNTGGTA